MTLPLPTPHCGTEEIIRSVVSPTVFGIRPELLTRHSALRNFQSGKSQSHISDLEISLDLIGQQEPIVLTTKLEVVDGWDRVLWRKKVNITGQWLGYEHSPEGLIWFRYLIKESMQPMVGDAISDQVVAYYYWRHYSDPRLKHFKSFIQFKEAMR